MEEGLYIDGEATLAVVRRNSPQDGRTCTFQLFVNVFYCMCVCLCRWSLQSYACLMFYHVVANWRVSEASETLLVVVQWKTRYVYTYIYIDRYVRHTLVARSWRYVMWEELSVSHF